MLRVNGAGRFQLLKVVMIESLLLCVVGFVFGTILGRVALSFLSNSSEADFKMSFNPYALNNDFIGLGQRYGQPSPRGNAGGFDVQSMMSSPNMASGGSDNTAHLKGKLNNLNDTIRTL